MNIVENRNRYFAISLAAMVIGLAVMLYHISAGNGPFNYDVEFTGGIELTVDVGRDFDNAEIEAIISDATGLASSQVQRILGTTQASIRVRELDDEARANLIAALKDKYGINDANISISDISAAISAEMQRAAVLAIFGASAGILLYVAIRFRDLRTGLSVVIPMLHDAVLVVLAYAVFRIPLNYAFIAVVLTVIGYSMNASIIVFDRVRENRKLLKRLPLDKLIDTSISQTFKRCIYTLITLLIVAIALHVVGVPAIQNFTLPISIGVIWGTYSSVFWSGSVLYVLSVGFKKAFARRAKA